MTSLSVGRGPSPAVSWAQTEFSFVFLGPSHGNESTKSQALARWGTLSLAPWVCQQVWPRGGAGLLAVRGLMVREGALAPSPLRVREAESSHGACEVLQKRCCPVCSLPSSHQDNSEGLFLSQGPPRPFVLPSLQAYCLAPFDLIKVRLQNQTEPRAKPGSPPPQYRGPVHCAASIFQAEGPRGLFRGAWALTLRDTPTLGIYFVTYEWLCRQFTLDGQTPSK